MLQNLEDFKGSDAMKTLPDTTDLQCTKGS